MSRAMLVTVLHRLDGLLSEKGADFTDVSAGEWYSDAVAWASTSGIVTGYGDGSFGTDDDISREQLAVFLYRYAGYLGLKTDSSGELDTFSDSGSVSGYAKEALSWAVGAGLMNGRSDSQLAPDGNATRAEVAVILERFVRLALDSYF